MHKSKAVFYITFPMLIGLTLAIINKITIHNYEAIPFVIVFVWIGYFVWFMRYAMEHSRKEKDERIREENEVEQYRLENEISEDAIEVKYFEGLNGISEQSVLFWADKENLHLFSENTGKHKIDINSIKQYTIKGDIHNELEISGGGTMHAKFGDAVGGAIIAGDAGAAIGMRGKNAPITSQNKVIDNRKTIIEVNINDKQSYIFFDSKVYDILLKVIPNKEISLINNAEQGIYDKIKQLAKLKDEGILTEVEFQVKKTKLLEKI